MVAGITSNLSLVANPACLVLDMTTTAGQAAGLAHDSVASCLTLATVYADAVEQTIGALSPVLLQQLDSCLKAALDVP